MIEKQYLWHQYIYKSVLHHYTGVRDDVLFFLVFENGLKLKIFGERNKKLHSQNINIFSQRRISTTYDRSIARGFIAIDDGSYNGGMDINGKWLNEQTNKILSVLSIKMRQPIGPGTELVCVNNSQPENFDLGLSYLVDCLGSGDTVYMRDKQGRSIASKLKLWRRI